MENGHGREILKWNIKLASDLADNLPPIIKTLYALGSKLIYHVCHPYSLILILLSNQYNINIYVETL